MANTKYNYGNLMILYTLFPDENEDEIDKIFKEHNGNVEKAKKILEARAPKVVEEPENKRRVKLEEPKKPSPIEVVQLEVHDYLKKNSENLSGHLDLLRDASQSSFKKVKGKKRKGLFSDTEDEHEESSPLIPKVSKPKEIKKAKSACCVLL